jgi:hypothetical protein
MTITPTPGNLKGMAHVLGHSQLAIGALSGGALASLRAARGATMIAVVPRAGGARTRQGRRRS